MMRKSDVGRQRSNAIVNRGRVSGFTIIEILLAIATLAILFALSAPLYQAFQVRNALFVAVDTFTQTLSRAQTLSVYMEEDSQWGVKITTGAGSQIDEIILFKGSDFAGRTTAFDEVFDVPSVLEVSGTTEIVFTKFAGELGAGTTTTISSPQAGSLQKVISVNTKGKITVTDE